MAGRPQTTARKVAELEALVVETYRRLDDAVPAMHKRPRSGGSSSTASPWETVYRANRALAVAVAGLGDHCRRAAGIEGAGPIRAALGDGAIQAMHDAGSNGNGGLALAGLPDDLPDRASIQSEVEWVAANLHNPAPMLGKAPSRTAISLLLDARRDDRVRQGFWAVMLSRRLAPGEPRPKPTGFEEDETPSDERDAELLRRLFGEERGDQV